MDEFDGVLRVAVGPTARTGNFNSIVTLTQQADDLAEIGRVDKLGENEQIMSMRWFDEMAVMVTFARSTRSTPSTSPTPSSRGCWAA